jgi:hypothetical protein
MRLRAVVPALSVCLVAGLVRAELPSVGVVHEATEYLQLSDLSRDGLLWSQALDELGGSGDGSEVFLLRGAEKIRLTDNEYTDNGARFVGDQVVWSGSVNPKGELFLYDGQRARQLTTNDRYEIDFAASADRVAWKVDDGEDEEIFVYDGHEVVQLTDNDLTDTGISIEGDWVSWITFRERGTELWLHERGAAQPRKLAHSPYYMSPAALHDGRAVWSQIPSDAGEQSFADDIFLFDGVRTVQVTNTPDVSESSPALSNELLVWLVPVGKGTAEIHLRDAAGERVLTRKASGLRLGAVDGDTVAWSENVGPNNSEVFAHRRGVTLQLSNSEGWDSGPIVSGNRVAWTYTSADQSEYAIWLASFGEDDAGAGGASGAGGLTAEVPSSGASGTEPGGAAGVASWVAAGRSHSTVGGAGGLADFALAGSAGSTPPRPPPRATSGGCECVVAPTGESLPGATGLGLIAAALGIAVARRQRAGHAGLKPPCPVRAS